jgi:hypothetical protein
MTQIVAFGERWEDGQDIRHDASYAYWRRKIQREITRAVALRDRVSLSALVRLSVLLRDRVLETDIRSTAVLSLVSGVDLLAPLDDGLRPILTEFPSRLGRWRKAEGCRAILSLSWPRWTA